MQKQTKNTKNINCVDFVIQEKKSLDKFLQYWLTANPDTHAYELLDVEWLDNFNEWQDSAILKTNAKACPNCGCLTDGRFFK